MNTFFWIWLFGFGSVATVEYIQDPQANSITAVAKVTTVAAAIYFGVLSASILVHRVFFHRLRKVVSALVNLHVADIK